MDRLLLVGYRTPADVGAHLERAARDAGIEVAFCDAQEAHGRLRRRPHWRPPRFAWFNRRVIDTCRTFRPSLLLATGLAPLGAPALSRIRRAGITTAHFLTDDPWNGEHCSRWFLRALEHYDLTFTPRRANLDDLADRCDNVSYLPFAFDPSLHFAELPDDAAGADVLLVGSADERRVRQARRLLGAGLHLELYGLGWERYPDLLPHARADADAPTMRRAVARAKVAIGLIRPANRDGHTMRSFELPAMGACVLAEATEEHRDLYGLEGEAVRYFTDDDELVQQTRALVADDDERQRLAHSARARIVDGRHTYAYRLATMLRAA